MLLWQCLKVCSFSNLQFMLRMEGVLDLQYSIPNDGDGHLENRL